MCGLMVGDIIIFGYAQPSYRCVYVNGIVIKHKVDIDFTKN